MLESHFVAQTNGKVKSENGKNPQEERIKALDRQLNIELKVKAGAENMIETCQKSKSDRRMLANATQMLEDSRRKIELIQMQLLRFENLETIILCLSTSRKYVASVCDFTFLIKSKARSTGNFKT